MATWIKRDGYRYKTFTSQPDIDKAIAETRPDDSDASDEEKRQNGYFYGNRKMKSLTVVELGRKQ